MDIVPAKCCLKAQTHPIISVCPGKESALKGFFFSIMSPPEGLGDILFFPGRPSVCLSVCLSVTNRVRSVT